MPKRRLKATAAPKNSAKSVAIATISATTHSAHVTGRRNCALIVSGRLRPVAIPSLAESAWISIAIRFDATMTHTSR